MQAGEGAGERLRQRVLAGAERRLPGLAGEGHHLRRGVAEPHRRLVAVAGFRRQNRAGEEHHLGWVLVENFRREGEEARRHLTPEMVGHQLLLEAVPGRGVPVLSPERSCRCARFGGMNPIAVGAPRLWRQEVPRERRRR